MASSKPDIEVVQIKSDDGHTFFVDKKCAIVSRVIESMLNTEGMHNIEILFVYIKT